MRKNVIVLSSLVLTMLLAFSMTGSVKANINSWMWLEPTFQGFDDFHDSNVIAYTEGGTAKLAVLVNRVGSGASSINVTAVSVIFDWGGNYTLAVSPVFIINDTISQAAFTVSFTVPSTSTASNLFLHSFSIFVKYVSTLGSGTFTASGDSFAVYSATQAEAQTTGQTASAYDQPPFGFSSPEANILWEKGDTELSKGDTAYMLGNFAAARTYYQNAITLYEQAYTAETAYSQDYREAQTGLITAQADSYDAQSSYYSGLGDYYSKTGNASLITAGAEVTQADAAVRQADAALTNAYGWLSIGIGWILIGIGAIFYGLRKPKTPV